MASTNIFERIFANVDEATARFITETVSNVISYITPIFTSMVIIYIVIWGYLMLFGKVNDAIQEGIFRMIRIGVIVTFALSVGTYSGVVVNLLQGGPEKLSAVVTGTTDGTTPQMLDHLFSKVFDVAKAAWDKGGVMNGNFGLYLIALIVLVVGSGLTLFVAFMVLLAKLMTVILLGIGPLFIISTLFEPLKRFFESWIGMVCNFGLLLILSASVGAMMVSLASTYISKMAPTESAAANMANLGSASMLCLVFALCILVVRQVPSIASALGGGVAMATQGAFGAAMNAMRPTSARRGIQNLKRESRATQQLGQGAVNAATSPYRAVKGAHAAYQKRFGANSVARG